MRKNPTGMGAGTGQHYRNVAAQMQAYVHKPRHRTSYRTYHQPYESQAEIVAEQFIQYGAERMGLPPSFIDEISGLARDLLRNAFI